MLDATKVTVMGGGRNKIATIDRHRETKRLRLPPPHLFRAVADTDTGRFELQADAGRRHVDLRERQLTRVLDHDNSRRREDLHPFHVRQSPQRPGDIARAVQTRPSNDAIPAPLEHLGLRSHARHSAWTAGMVRQDARFNNSATHGSSNR